MRHPGRNLLRSLLYGCPLSGRTLLALDCVFLTKQIGHIRRSLGIVRRPGRKLLCSLLYGLLNLCSLLHGFHTIFIAEVWLLSVRGGAHQGDG